eukprot:6619910-Prymnesium_polylepis.1
MAAARPAAAHLAAGGRDEVRHARQRGGRPPEEVEERVDVRLGREVEARLALLLGARGVARVE